MDVNISSRVQSNKYNTFDVPQMEFTFDNYTFSFLLIKRILSVTKIMFKSTFDYVFTVSLEIRDMYNNN